MKKGISLALFVMLSITAKSQDKLYLRTNPTSYTEVKINEIDIDFIKYNKTSNLKGPVYTASKSDIYKIIFENGDVEEFSLATNSNIARQESKDLKPGSKLFVKYIDTDDEDNVNGVDAIQMFGSYIKGKTTCELVNSLEEADFEISLRVIKKMMGDRKAQVEIKHLASNDIVFESKWKRGSSTVFTGYSGTRAAVGNVVKKDLLKEYKVIRR